MVVIMAANSPFLPKIVCEPSYDLLRYVGNKIKVGFVLRYIYHTLLVRYWLAQPVRQDKRE